MTLLSELLGRRMRLIRPLTTELVHERDLPVEMDDGVVLLADRWVAAATAGRPQPTVLVRSPYGRRQFVGVLFGRLLAERGLQVVVQSVRGTFGSGGTFAPFDERADGAATLRWLRAQPWHAGKVGTFGPSYLGLVQWALAADEPEDLAAMAIQVSASEFHSQTYAGGSISLETIASWMAIVAAQEKRLAPLQVNRALRSLGELLREHPLIGLDEIATGAPVAWLRESFEQPGRDGEYWMRRDFSAAVGRVRVPVSFVGGWHDILLPWMLEDVRALQDAGRTPRLTIGPWTHTSPELAAVGHRDGIAFLRAHLLGDDRLLRAEPETLPVRLRLTGEGAVQREFPAWPPPRAQPRRLFLREGGTLSPQPPEDANGAERYRYDPADPTPSFGGPVLMSREAVVDNGPLEARSDVLTFTTEPLEATLEAIGRPSVEIWARSDAPSFDVFARVCDVDPAGVSRNVCDALASVRPERDVPDADGSVRVSFELWPLGHRFAAGHRIRLQVSSGAYPRYARNPGTGEDPAAAAPGRMRAAEIEILRGRERPSSLTLPVMPGGSDGDAAGGAGAG
ncbi:MAG TPA: CocE/NonD family hydrolase [Solirubrobacteraceae bacterium]|nr:CocE/NonD family hydrolase [Solirubrobacteraceae bacterium]